MEPQSKTVTVSIRDDDREVSFQIDKTVFTSWQKNYEHVISDLFVRALEQFTTP